MNINDLDEYGISVKGEISDKDLGLLILNYNRMILSDQSKINNFEKLEGKALAKFLEREDDFGKDFLLTCLAICEKDIQEEYFKGEDKEEALLKIHQFVCKLKSVEQTGKENIRQARNIAEQEDKLKLKAQRYQQMKDQYAFLRQCATDEIVFDKYYATMLQGKVGKDEAKNMILAKYNESRQNFETRKSNYFGDFVRYQVAEGVRVGEGEKVG